MKAILYLDEDHTLFGEKLYFIWKFISGNTGVMYHIIQCVLMRKWRPSIAPADDEWAVKHQIVVVTSYRPLRSI